MTPVVLPGACPLRPEQRELLARLLATMSEAERRWLVSYLTREGHEERPEVPEPRTAERITVLYGTETGNARALAFELGRRLEGRGLPARVLGMDEYEPRQLLEERVLLVVVSTHGDGDPPDNARTFYDFLMSRRAPLLPHLSFAVLALGDRSYPQFCKTGREFDERLRALGATPLDDVVLCDIDYEDTASSWMDRLLRELPDLPRLAPAKAPVAPSPARAGPTKDDPFPAEVLENLRLTGRGSDKETHHLELSIRGSGIAYAPGDSLGVVPENDPSLVDALLERTGWSPDEPVRLPRKGLTLPLREVLLHHVEITRIFPSLIAELGRLGVEGLQELARSEAASAAYCQGSDLLDLALAFPVGHVPPEEVVLRLRPLVPRLYSIASSPEAYPEEVHLTVRLVSYHAFGRERLGVASGHLVRRTSPGERLPVFLQPNPDFRMPEDGNAPMILVGAGTGVAPFRAFLQEKEVSGRQNPIWLFFGERRFRTDFLYQVEWQRWLKRGTLTRMDVAFSRDGAEKRYVQHRIWEKAADVWAWLMEGAYLYVCGDRRMAEDVETTLAAIARRQGAMDEESASAFVAELRRTRRYRRDVY